MSTTIMEPLSSSEARAAILSNHGELRGLVMETIQSVSYTHLTLPTKA